MFKIIIADPKNEWRFFQKIARTMYPGVFLIVSHTRMQIQASEVQQATWGTVSCPPRKTLAVFHVLHSASVHMHFILR